MYNFAKRNIIEIIYIVVLLSLMLLLTIFSKLSEAQTLNIFESGTIIRSSEMNENFEILNSMTTNIQVEFSNYKEEQDVNIDNILKDLQELESTLNSIKYEIEEDNLTIVPVEENAPFNINYPDGLNNLIPIMIFENEYVVPEGKNLYITSVSQCYNVKIDDVQFGSARTFLIAGSNQRVELNYTCSSDTKISGGFTGFLVDSIVDPVSLDVRTPYTIPEGKNLYIFQFEGHYDLWIDDFKYCYDVLDFKVTKSSPIPIIIKSNSIIKTTSDQFVSVNGYLM